MKMIQYQQTYLNYVAYAYTTQHFKLDKVGLLLNKSSLDLGHGNFSGDCRTDTQLVGLTIQYLYYQFILGLVNILLGPTYLSYQRGKFLQKC